MTNYTSHSDYRAMLAGIRSDPADDLKRLVLADWLDERGELERAELIRVQCADLYTVSCQQVKYPLADVSGQESLADIEMRCLDYQDGRSEVVENWCRQCKLRHRVLQIIESWDDEATRHVPHPFRANGWTGYVVKTYERGFLHTVRGPLSSLIGGECGRCGGTGRQSGELWAHQFCPQCHGTGRTVGVLPELVREGVVERVEVTDREPWTDGVQEFEPSEYGWCWWREAEWGNRGGANNQLGNLPDSIIDVMADIYQYHRVTWNGPRDNQHIGFPTRNAAVSALSAALIQWAESEGEK